MAPRRSAPKIAIQQAFKPRKAAAGTKKSRGPAYSDQETGVVLDLVAEHLPSGANMWMRLAQDYAEIALERGWPLRDEESLRNKFKALKNSPKPTGDPNCPWDVKAAKRLQVMIDQSRDVVGFDEEEDDGEEDEAHRQDDEDYIDNDNEDQMEEDNEAEAQFEAEFNEENRSPETSSMSTSNPPSSVRGNNVNKLRSTLLSTTTPPNTAASLIKKGAADPAKRVGGLTEDKLKAIGERAKRTQACGALSQVTAKRNKIDSSLEEMAKSRTETSSILQTFILQSLLTSKEESARREEERVRREEKERREAEERREERREETKSMMMFLAALFKKD